MKLEFDYIIIGAGIYGLYIARQLALNYPQRKICVLEYDHAPFQRASYINQARVHNGYHYPRSLATALKSAGYYSKFIQDYAFAINDKFRKIYAVSRDFSYASAANFEAFCAAADIPCAPAHPGRYFRKGMVEGCYVTEEVSLDAEKICAYFVSEIGRLGNTRIMYNARIQGVDTGSGRYRVTLDGGARVEAPFVLNASYASVNQILDLFGFEKFRIKYEIAEICLCDVSPNVVDAGLTVMDGPFFSLMPFGLSGYHSLSSVHFTPHKTCHDSLPHFDCQARNSDCTPQRLANCNLCPARPSTAWTAMKQLARKYLNDDIEMNYHKSLFAIKPILKASETSDSRPTVLKQYSENPAFVSVLSGKFNTMYDLEALLA